MNTAEYVDQKIQELKSSGTAKPDAVWEAGKLCVGWPYIFGDRGQECTPSKRQAVYNSHPDQEGLISKCQVLKKTKGSCAGCQWYPDGKRVRSFDCRGFTYWIIKQIYNFEIMGAGATSQWNDDDNWKAKGTIDTIPDDLLVCLFYTQKGNPKVMQHTGLGYKGETLECGNGVQWFKTRNKKWTHWAVPKCVAGDVPEPDPDRKPILRKGDKGDWVKKAQELLLKDGYDLGKWGADGSFGNATESAVKEFQKANGIEADGVIGPDTWTALEQPVSALYIVQIPHLTKYKAEALVQQYAGATMTQERG